MEGAFLEKDERFAEWYVWAKREIGNDSRVCLGAAQAAVEALDGGAGEDEARAAARRSVVGQGIALLSRIPPRQRAYAEWYDWSRREIGGGRDRLHMAARTALQRLDTGGDATQAAAAAREATAATPASTGWPGSQTAQGAFAAPPEGPVEPLAVAPPGPTPSMVPTVPPPAYPPYPAYQYAAIPPPQAPGFAYAGFWRRLAAWLIDSVLLAIGVVILSFVIAFFALIGVVSSGQSITTASFSGLSLAIYFIEFVLIWLYYAGLESSAWQGTIGKRMMRLLVTDRFGRRVGFGRATGRYFGKVGTGLVFLIAYLVVLVIIELAFVDLLNGPLATWLAVAYVVVSSLSWLVFIALMIAVTKRKQSLHDMVAGTLVVRQEHLALITAAPQVAPPQQPPAGTGEVQGA